LSRQKTDPTHTSELREALTALLTAVDVKQDWIASANLNDLIQESLKYKTK
jgi:hypothetical protein